MWTCGHVDVVDTLSSILMWTCGHVDVWTLQVSYLCRHMDTFSMILMWTCGRRGHFKYHTHLDMWTCGRVDTLSIILL